MNEITKEKKKISKSPSATVTSKILSKKDTNLQTEVDTLPLNSSITNTFARGGPYEEDTDEADFKHDRREQLMASNAFDNMVQK